MMAMTLKVGFDFLKRCPMLINVGHPIYSELVSDKFTVDNLGEVSNIVKSNVLPLEMIEWSCMPQRFLQDSNQDRPERFTLLEHAVHAYDMELLKFLIELGAEQQALAAEEEDDQTCYTIKSSAFLAAIQHGRTAILAEMIRVSPSLWFLVFILLFW